MTVSPEVISIDLSEYVDSNETENDGRKSNEQKKIHHQMSQNDAIVPNQFDDQNISHHMNHKNLKNHMNDQIIPNLTNHENHPIFTDSFLIEPVRFHCTLPIMPIKSKKPMEIMPTILESPIRVKNESRFMPLRTKNRKNWIDGMKEPCYSKTLGVHLPPEFVMALPENISKRLFRLIADASESMRLDENNELMKDIKKGNGVGKRSNGKNSCKRHHKEAPNSTRDFANKGLQVSSSISRLYTRDAANRLLRLQHYSFIREEKEKEELQDCTFRPKVNSLPIMHLSSEELAESDLSDELFRLLELTSSEMFDSTEWYSLEDSLSEMGNMKRMLQKLLTAGVYFLSALSRNRVWEARKKWMMAMKISEKRKHELTGCTFHPIVNKDYQTIRINKEGGKPRYLAPTTARLNQATSKSMPALVSSRVEPKVNVPSQKAHSLSSAAILQPIKRSTKSNSFTNFENMHFEKAYNFKFSAPTPNSSLKADFSSLQEIRNQLADYLIQSVENSLEEISSGPSSVVRTNTVNRARNLLSSLHHSLCSPLDVGPYVDETYLLRECK